MMGKALGEYARSLVDSKATQARVFQQQGEVLMAKKTKKTTKNAMKRAVRKVARRPMKKAVAKRVAAKKVVARKAVAKKAPRAKGFALVSATPGFTANDAAASIKWYCDVLGFKVVQRWEHEGQFRGAQIGNGAVSVNIGQDDWKMGRDRAKGQATRIYFMTGPDIDQYVNLIKARGGVLAQELQDGWGVRSFAIDDPDGFKLTFMTPLTK
jgi:catechol 2,3-dioxygenase-like lactoylglutathione lyase family enzyme